MKKSKRIFCMLLAAVMLLGVVPAYAAASISPLAALLAIPVSGQLLNAGPVSSSISKPSEPAPAPAPASEPTPAPAAPSASPTSNGRLPDGTTGATAGVAGVTQTESLKGLYTSRIGLNIQTKRVSRVWKDKDEPFALTVDYSKVTTANLVGVTIDADMLVDVYKFISGTGYTFVCQYDTHGTGPLTITMEPLAANKDRIPVASAKESYTDVNPGDWYYDAVMAVNKGGMIHTVFDRDPGDSTFKPNELLTGSEMQFVIKRLFGFETEELIMGDSTASDTDTRTCGEHCSPQYKYSCQSKATRLNVLSEIMARIDSYNVTPLAQTKTEISAADINAIEGIARTVATDSQHGHRGNGFATYEENYAVYKNKLTRAGELNLIRTPATPATIDFDARITRAELCVILYRAGMTEFGCCAATNLKK